MTYPFCIFHYNKLSPFLSQTAHNHEAPCACNADRPTREDNNEDNERRSEALSNDERLRTGQNFR